MRTPESDEALVWLAGRGVTSIGPDRWLVHGRECTSADVVHDYADDAVHDGRPAADLLRRGFGLLDLLEHYGVTTQIRFLVTGEDDPVIRAVFWAGYRERLEREEPAEPVLYSLWADWFEDHATSDEAFREVLADDVRRLRSADRLADLAAGRLHRRATRVLEHSGPVGWLGKHDVYRAAATVPALHRAVFRGLLTSYHDFYGDLYPAEAGALLDRLVLPPGTAHLSRLRAVLRAGARHHYADPGLWESVAPG